MKRNQHEGESLLVIASGPSLNDFNVNDLQAHRTIGMNQTSRRFDADYVCLLDSPNHFGEGMKYAMRSLHKSEVLFHINYSAEWKRLGSFTQPTSETIEWLPGHGWQKWDIEDFKPTLERWDQDDGALYALPHGPTSAGVAVWLAVFLGAQRIGVIGVDHGKEYFHESWKPSAMHDHHLEEARHHWGKLVDMVFDLTGVETYNLSQRSQIDTFPSLELHEL